jgi:hypothetical protein
MNKVCTGSFKDARDVKPPFTFAACPICGRTLKLRYAGGGYDRYANYYYFPRHHRG